MPDGGKTAETGLVIANCPSCGAGEPIKRQQVNGQSHVVRCRRCGVNWPAKLKSSGELVVSAPQAQRQEQGQPQAQRQGQPQAQRQGRSVVWSDATTIDAVRKPLVSFSDSTDPWSARDEPIPAISRPPRRSAFLDIGITALAILFIGTFFGARHLAVAAVPDLAGLYSAVGMKVTIDPLVISGLTSERRNSSSGTSLIVTGFITNASPSGSKVPRLSVGLLNEEGAVVAKKMHPSPVSTLKSGARVPFLLQIPRPSTEASRVEVRLEAILPQPPSAAGLIRKSIQ